MVIRTKSLVLSSRPYVNLTLDVDRANTCDRSTVPSPRRSSRGLSRKEVARMITVVEIINC
jgi:hypothetical protein